MTPPTRTNRTHHNYARLEQHRQQILCPATWSTLLSDYSALGSNVVEGRM